MCTSQNQLSSLNKKFLVADEEVKEQVLTEFFK